MTFKATMSYTLSRFFVLSKHRSEPAWARLLVDLCIALGFALFFTFIGGLMNRKHLGDWSALWAVFGINLVISTCITLTFHAMWRSLELGLSDAMLARLDRGKSGWWSPLFFGGFSILGCSLGMAIGLVFVGLLLKRDMFGGFFGNAGTVGTFLLISLGITAVNWVFWKIRGRNQALRLQATDAQLRLLQAQIEPHFLFNTLANVHGLMEVDAPRAKLMLEAFTDYLRASLGQIRHDEASLGEELDMVASYLTLLQIRMVERLRFRIEVPADLRAARLPPLLLQPLVENAVHHGLEPKVDGGEVVIRASQQQGQLLISVSDDGLGLEAPRRAASHRAGRGGAGAGNGIALSNIRSRLQTRFGERATLTLQAQLPAGTLAQISLPLTLVSSSNPSVNTTSSKRLAT
nr:histidine kinase [uncultured Roseateles sp.]